jgi:hypothetical protein
MKDLCIPYNLNSGQEYLKKLRDIIKNYSELGGTPYEILEASGLKEIESFGLLDEEIWTNSDELIQRRTEKRIIAIEVYVDYLYIEKMKKVFLFSEHINDYALLLKEGIVSEGKLIIKYKKFQELLDKGYQSISCRNVKAWNEQQITAGNGFNIVVLMLDYKVDLNEELSQCEYWSKLSGENLGNYYLQVDLYAIETCFEILKKEKFIRENLDPRFQIERINVLSKDDEILLEQETKGVFLYEMGYDVEHFPECYRKLAYQTAYIKYHYPRLDEMMKEVSNIGNEIDSIQSIGIALEMSESHGAYCLSDEKVRLIHNDINSQEIGAKWSFEGISSLLNAGVAASEIGLRIRKIKKSLENINGNEINSAVISLPMVVPEKAEIQNSMKERENRLNGDSNDKLNLEVYRELDLYDASGWDIVKRASEMAGIQHVVILPRALAISCAYEHMSKENELKEGGASIVYDWGKDNFSATLIRRHRGEVEILGQEVIKNPAIDKEDYVTMNYTLLDCMKHSMKQEIMKDGKLHAWGLNSECQNAWDTFYSMAESVINQVIRGNKGTLIWDNGWMRVVESYPGRAFQKIFEPYYKRTEDVVKKVIYEAGFKDTDISKIFLAGEWGNYSYIWGKLKEFIGRQGEICVMEDTNLAAVKGAAYVSMKTYK